MTTAPGPLKPKPNGLDSAATHKIIKWMSAAHVRLYRRTGGRVGKTWRIGSALRRGVPICLLTTIGRTSGQPRTVALLYLRHGEDIVLVASQGGLPENPQWYRNLLADPNVTVQIGARIELLRARVARAEERTELWPRLTELYADFASYQAWTKREIPVVICERVR